MGVVELRDNSKEKDKKTVKRTKKKATAPTPTIRGIKKLPEKIQTVRQTVEHYLGDKKNEYLLITTKFELHRYVESCRANGIVAIDTETDGLDTLHCKLVGFSLFTPGNKACYVPVNHVDYTTDERITNQLTEEEVKPFLEKLTEIKTVWFNSKFDIKVFRHTTGVYFTPYYDAYIASRLLNENEKDNGLKALHKKYILRGKEDAFSFGELFEKISFDLIPVDVGYLYAARDAQVTYELYEFQLPYLTKGTEECTDTEQEGVSYVFWNIEMPIITHIADMEDLGVGFDFEYNKVLSEEYNAELKRAEEEYYKELKKYTDIEYSISSPKQLSTLFYDELGVLTPVYDRKEQKYKKSVDVNVLESMNHPLAKLILNYRSCQKLISTYIDKLAEVARADGRIHTNFNQVGTDTGRFSSSNPCNLQNIPSHNTRIRKMFIPSEGCVMLSSDFSAQEVRMVAHMSGDQKMIQAYKDGKDLYCEIASLSFHVPYEQCKEFNSDGTTNPAGKERRSIAKKIVLSINYGKGIKSLAEDLNKTKQEAQEIYDAVMHEFPDLERFIYESKAMAHQKGYVPTIFGRKRRLPEIKKPKYEIYVNGSGKLSERAEKNIKFKLSSLWFEDRQKYIEELKKDGITVIDNNGIIARAERQCVNARVQGSSADQVKIAIRNICEDEVLKKCGFRLLMTIHDEVVGECPLENAKIAKERLNYIMVHSLDGILSVPMACDTECTDRWYGETMEV